MTDQMFDVIQVGLGPCGLTMATVIGQAGHSVAAIERHNHLYGLPRAGHVDHEIMRILQSLDAEKATFDDAVAPTEYVWVNRDGDLLLEFPWGTTGISGYASDYMQYQPVIEDSLYARATGDENITLLQGWEAVEFQDRGDHIEVTLRKTAPADSGRPVLTDETKVVRGRYLIGADGAASAVRQWLGVERDDLGFNERWLDVDVLKKRELSFDFDCGQICDPARPRCVLPLGKRHRRWEWCLLPGEKIEDLEKPEKAWELLAAEGIGPDDVEIVRQLVYTFEARTAKHFRNGKVFLIGDAAHTMPPFMGQGMCAGMRDAKNLGWKLDLVLRGLAPDEILNTYEEELRPHVLDWTVISLEAGKVPCITDEEEARKRDELFKSGFRPPIPDFPQLRNGILHRNSDHEPVAPAGELSLQARVTRGGQTDLFDRVFNANGKWQIISTAGDPRSVLREDQIASLQALGVVVANLAREGGDAVDADGEYGAYHAEHHIEVTISRPDFYLFGVAPSLSELPELVDDLLTQIAVPSRTKVAA